MFWAEPHLDKGKSADNLQAFDISPSQVFKGAIFVKIKCLVLSQRKQTRAAINDFFDCWLVIETIKTKSPYL